MGYKIITDDNLAARLERCIAHQQSQIECAQSIREIFDGKTSPEIPSLLKMAVDQLTAGLGLCHLAGITPEELLRGWVNAKEKQNPHLLG